AVVVGGRRVGEGAVAVQRHRAVARVADLDRREAVPVHVAVVGEHAGGGHDELRVLVRGVGVIRRHRRVIDRVDGEVHRVVVGGGVGAVLLPVAEVFRAVVVGGGGGGGGAVAAQGGRAVGDVGPQVRRARVARVHVAVVGEHAGG